MELLKYCGSYNNLDGIEIEFKQRNNDNYLNHIFKLLFLENYI